VCRKLAACCGPCRSSRPQVVHIHHDEYKPL
jgi:hypothetical protein